MEPFESLAYVTTQKVWVALNRRGHFLKHVEDEEFDATYEAISAAVEEALIERIGRLPA